MEPYHFEAQPTSDPKSGSVAIARVPHHFQKVNIPPASGQNFDVMMDTSIPNPHDPEVVHDKYWAQRRRLFSRFDQGILSLWVIGASDLCVGRVRPAWTLSTRSYPFKE